MFFQNLGKHLRVLLQLHGSLLPLRLLFQLLVLWIQLLQKNPGRFHSPHSPRRAGGPGSAFSTELPRRFLDPLRPPALSPTVPKLLPVILLIVKHHAILAKRNPRSHGFATSLGNTAAQTPDDRQGIGQGHQFHNIFQESSHPNCSGSPTFWFWPNDPAPPHEWNPIHL